MILRLALTAVSEDCEIVVFLSAAAAAPRTKDPSCRRLQGAPPRHRQTFAVKAIRGDGHGGFSPGGLRDLDCLDACCGHPNVVQYLGVHLDRRTGDLFTFMELAGASLRGRLTRQHSEAETRAYMRQLVGAAEWMHAAGVVHRHITPENILVGPGGELRLCGFGMATTAADPATEAYPDGDDVQLQYLSPQQVLGTRYNSPAVDVWALGCVMAEPELLSGEPVIESGTEEKMMEEMEHLKFHFTWLDLDVFYNHFWLPELSQAGRELLFGLLRFDDDERLTAADALRHRWFKEEEEDGKAPAVAMAAEVEAEHPASAAAHD
ncbi:hypothetical protein ACP4OV_009170 [Aristida adscensionis]